VKVCTTIKGHHPFFKLFFQVFYWKLYFSTIFRTSQ